MKKAKIVQICLACLQSGLIDIKSGVISSESSKLCVCATECECADKNMHDKCKEDGHEFTKPALGQCKHCIENKEQCIR